MSEWKDISSAPRDGTVFLAMAKEWDHCIPACFHSKESALFFPDSCEYEDEDTDVLATHWIDQPEFLK